MLVVSWFGLLLAAPALASSSAGLSNALLPETPAILRAKMHQDLGPATLRVRGVPIETPFQVKILVKEFSFHQAWDKSALKVGGTDLSDQKGNYLGSNADLECGPYKNPLTLLNESPFEKFPDWICRGKNFQHFLKRNRLVLGGPAGFISVGKNLFRGKIELVQKENRLLVINDLPVEPYLVGLLNKEMNSKFPAEALRAQAIAARSYALATAADRRRQGHDFDLYGTESDQVYAGSDFEDAIAYRLVNSVRGRVLVHQNEVVKAYYHSSNGGFSELPANVWGKSDRLADTAPFRALASPVDAQIREAQWSIVLSSKIGLAWPDLGEIKRIEVLERSEGKRVKWVRVRGTRAIKTLSGTEFRRRFGTNVIKSTFFTVSALLDAKAGLEPKAWRIEGYGWGHGVGLSQLGAKALAQQGRSAEQILSTYYPFAHVETLALSEDIEKTRPSKGSLSIQTR